MVVRAITNTRANKIEHGINTLYRALEHL